MRRLCLAVVLSILAAGAASGQVRRSGLSSGPPKELWVAADRVERFHQWLIAVDGHEPGERDDATDQVGGWTNAELRGLWVEVNVFAQLTRNLKLSRFTFKNEGASNATEVRYTPLQLRQLVTWACAGTARFDAPDCLEIKAASNADPDMRRLARHVADDRARTHDDNYVLRRGALLHSDIAMLQPHGAVEPFAPSAQLLPGPNTWRVDMSDGRGLDIGMSEVHWDIARLALDNVKGDDPRKPAPERDAMVRAWYIATAAWMQFNEDHDTLHLTRARDLFANDPAILFLSGSQRETYAGPEIQAATRSVTLPTGLTIAVESERGELRRAESFFRRAVALQPDMGEAHLRLGRVLGQLGRHQEAAAEIEQALTLVDDEALRYYGELFAGAEEEALGRFDAARAAYERASALFPLAQSPFIALSELAHRRGDRPAAVAAMAKVFALPAAVDGARDDPWWRYHVAQARNADQLLDAVRAPFRRIEH
jgi:tetratricopeptide (TPR) repeat protein